jgi:hypothetical protein
MVKDSLETLCNKLTTLPPAALGLGGVYINTFKSILVPLTIELAIVCEYDLTTGVVSKSIFFYNKL